MGILGAILGFLGSGLSALVGIKETQANVISTAINAATTAGSDEGARAQAAAAAIAAVYQQGGIIERLWRPLLMWGILIIVFGHFLGYINIPANDPFGARLMDFLEMGLMGYLPLRTFEKVINQLSLGFVIKKFIENKLT